MYKGVGVFFLLIFIQMLKLRYCNQKNHEFGHFHPQFDICTNVANIIEYLETNRTFTNQNN